MRALFPPTLAPKITPRRLVKVAFEVIVVLLLSYIALAVMVYTRLPPYDFVRLNIFGPLALSAEISLEPSVEEDALSAEIPSEPPVEEDALSAEIPSEPSVENDASYWIDRLLEEDQYILHFRHTARDVSIDIQSFDFFQAYENLGFQDLLLRDFVCLNREGRAQAEVLSLVVEKLGRDFEVIASPSCRAQEHALIAFGKIDLTNVAHLHQSAVPATERDAFMDAQLNFFRSHDFEKPGITVIVGHDRNAYSGAYGAPGPLWVERLDGEVIRQQGGVSVLSFDRSRDMLIVHYTFERLTDFLLNLPQFCVSDTCTQKLSLTPEQSSPRQ